MKQSRDINRLRRRQHEGIPIRIAELGERAPRLHGRRFDEVDAARAELAVGRFDVVACERAIEEGADTVFMAIRREQHDAGARHRHAQLDPALARAHRLVGGDLEAELVGVEGEGAVLVGDRNADEFELGDHGNVSC
jgi:hypothetical protein